jgi:hypothetical protein
MSRPHEAQYIQFMRKNKGRQEVNLTYEEFLYFTTFLQCHYCGVRLNWNKVGRYNLDRMDNDEGYNFKNIVPCCTDCNRGKGSIYSYAEWVVMTIALRKYRRQLGRPIL